jgi:hypothetical protein
MSGPIQKFSKISENCSNLSKFTKTAVTCQKKLQLYDFLKLPQDNPSIFCKNNNCALTRTLVPALPELHKNIGADYLEKIAFFSKFNKF